MLFRLQLLFTQSHEAEDRVREQESPIELAIGRSTTWGLVRAVSLEVSFLPTGAADDVLPYLIDRPMTTLALALNHVRFLGVIRQIVIL